jgi:hypothetical protein
MFLFKFCLVIYFRAFYLFVYFVSVTYNICHVFVFNIVYNVPTVP